MADVVIVSIAHQLHNPRSIYPRHLSPRKMGQKVASIYLLTSATQCLLRSLLDGSPVRHVVCVRARTVWKWKRERGLCNYPLHVVNYSADLPHGMYAPGSSLCTHFSRAQYSPPVLWGLYRLSEGSGGDVYVERPAEDPSHS